MAKQWWHLTADEVARELATDPQRGLEAQEALKRSERYGPNQLREKQGRGAFAIFIDQFRTLIIWILIGAAVVSGFLKEWVDAVAIVAIVVLNALLGFIQEFRAEKSLEALKKLSAPNSKVIRDGERSVVRSSDLVPGDLIEVESGDNIPADCRLVWLTSNFSVQEASLTGESTPVAKTQLALKEERDVPLAERGNMLYLGTSAVSGKARAVVAATGMDTELGKIAGMIQSIEREVTPLQKKLEQFGAWIVYLCLALVGIVFLLGVARGGKVLDMFLTAVSLAVAAIPEGLPAVVTIALALGVQRMVRRNALIRKLPSVETLGSATVICSDKTGTLTRNEMTVRAAYAGPNLYRVTGTGYEPRGEFTFAGKPVIPAAHPDLLKAMEIAVLCNGAELARRDTVYAVVGDPTEGALLTAALKLGISKSDVERECVFVNEIPFDSERKMMSVIRRRGGQTIAFVKGAPDLLLAKCAFIEENGRTRRLNDQDRKTILFMNNDLSNQALRVLAMGYRALHDEPQEFDDRSVERELVFCGLVAMIDPPREEVKVAIQACKSAGIRTVMITGDHKNTAVAIARELGFFSAGQTALTGEELDKLDDDAFAAQISSIPVYARVSPEHKLRIVRAWRQRGEVVAMTGDGVNDAPALKEADIGVAMGITGTDVTKEVSDMVVTDDNFASIVAAVEEGRGIYDNIRKFIRYLLSCNAGEILVMFISSLIGLPVPLFPIHILWINLVTDGLPALALGVDPVDPDVMRRPPRPTGERVITRGTAVALLGQGMLIASCSLLAFCFVLYVEKETIARARTAAFIVLACSQLFHAYNCRSSTQSLFRIGLFTNKKLIAATGISFLLQMAVVYVPFLQKVFKTEALDSIDWLMAVTVSSFPLWAMEIVKRTVPRGKRVKGR